MAISKSAKVSSYLRYSTTTTIGDQSQTDSYSLSYNKSIPTGVAGTPTNYFSDYAKSTGTLAAGANLEINLSGIDHQTLEGATVTRIFSHVNGFVFENTNATGVADILVIGATGTNACTNMFNGGSGSIRITPYSSFSYTDYYGTSVTHDNRMIGVRNISDRTMNYKYMALGMTGVGSA
ncbi:MAG: hypothetical protein MK031_10845 [Alphaproteobacteria bacterium]|nr:hypothetical protein [Alphaproteobacteria bacterium]